MTPAVLERIASGADREAREACSRWVYHSVVPFGVALALLAQAAALGFVPALREER